MGKNRRLSDSYKFPGFRAYQKVKGIYGDQKSLIITMKRVEKNNMSDLLTILKKFL
jgi:hypothetical protein